MTVQGFFSFQVFRGVRASGRGRAPLRPAMTPDLWTILLGWALAGGSPGAATLAISGTAMAHGRFMGFAAP